MNYIRVGCILLVALLALPMCVSAIVTSMTVDARVDYGCKKGKEVYITPITPYGPQCDPVLVENHKVNFQLFGLADGDKVKFVATSPSWKHSKKCVIIYNGKVMNHLPYKAMGSANIRLIVH